ncbi:MAG: LysR family transcriptional regulator [Desulfovibrionaceae bacterium]
MEFHHLRTFVAVAEEGRLGSASERLHLSQPSVSAHVKALEEELGVPLFRRTSKGMLLTSEGRELLEHAHRILTAAGDLVVRAKILRQEVRGTLRLGLNTDSIFLRVMQLAALLGERHPNVELKLLQSVSGRIADDLRNGNMDAGFVFRENEPEDFPFLLLRPLKLFIMGPIAWEERIRHADWKAISEMPWIWTPPHCPCYLQGEKLFAAKGLRLCKGIEADHESVVNGLIVAGKGISLVREDEAEAAEKAGTMVRWPGLSLSLGAYLVLPTGREADPLILALRSAVAEVWGLSQDETRA